jgi:hypothetical protein
MEQAYVLCPMGEAQGAGGGGALALRTRIFLFLLSAPTLAQFLSVLCAQPTQLEGDRSRAQVQSWLNSGPLLAVLSEGVPANTL